MPKARINVESGTRFGMLTVVREVEQIPGHRMFELLCDCGNLHVVRLIHLRRTHNAVRSCGCRKRAVRGEGQRTHGMRQTPTYSVWCGMLSRCRNPNGKSYPDYGGRGIKVCERWHKFENFLADMGERPSNEHEIDRVDNDRGYEPGNVRWVLRQEHARNKRKQTGTKSEFRGVDFWKDKRWRARIVIDRKLIHLGMFTTEEAAARAYDAVARLYKGYRLNFPEESE